MIVYKKIFRLFRTSKKSKKKKPRKVLCWLKKRNLFSKLVKENELLPSSWVCRIACSACSPARRACVFGVRNVSFSENIAYVLNGWPQFTYSLFQIMFCWFDYISFCLFTVNLLSLTLLTSSNGWKPLSIFKKSVLKGLLRGYSKITSIRKREGSSREVWQKMTGGKAVAEKVMPLSQNFSVPSYISDRLW